jgi:hypothetical protein
VAPLFDAQHVLGRRGFVIHVERIDLRTMIDKEAVATARTNRRLDGGSHVRFVYRLFLRYREYHLSGALEEGRRRFWFRRLNSASLTKKQSDPGGPCA